MALTMRLVLAILAVCAVTSPIGALPASQAPVDLSELWEPPADLSARDLFNGPWGAALAPDPDATYVFVAPKKGGINPGMTVRDPQGRTWKVKQPPTTGRNAEGPIEVVLSRVLSALGYHQPPVYFLPAFAVEKSGRVRRAPGGRFRLSVPVLRDCGEWDWTENPFVGTRPYQGLLVILLMLNSSDLKDSNNTLYEFTAPCFSESSDCTHTSRLALASTTRNRSRRWYVVRDLGTALGSTARLAPVRGDAAVFERLGFIKGFKRGFVDFHYNGRHQHLVDGRITAADVRWASELLSGLTREQWRDAFRAGGYDRTVSDRFIDRLLAKIAEGLTLQGPGEIR